MRALASICDQRHPRCKGWPPHSVPPRSHPKLPPHVGGTGAFHFQARDVGGAGSMSSLGWGAPSVHRGHGKSQGKPFVCGDPRTSEGPMGGPLNGTSDRDCHGGAAKAIESSQKSRAHPVVESFPCACIQAHRRKKQGRENQHGKFGKFTRGAPRRRSSLPLPSPHSFERLVVSSTSIPTSRPHDGHRSIVGHQSTARSNEGLHALCIPSNERSQHSIHRLWSTDASLDSSEQCEDYWADTPERIS